MNISIIVPVLNEERYICNFIDVLIRACLALLIVVRLLEKAFLWVLLLVG
jgi:glycosyltransferase involved in cell wall biosynthesis